MKITGSFTVDAPREAFFDALQDPAVLARTLPGCESLEVIGDDAYAATVTAGVASIKGTYQGTVRMTDKQRPDRYRLHAEGSGSPGTIQADAELTLEVDGDTTIVHYDADAVIGGMIGGVGQRMIAGAARKTAGEFLSAVAHEVVHGPAPEAPAPTPSGEIAPAAAPQGEPGGTGTVYAGSTPQKPTGDRSSSVELLAAFALGAAVALAGVVVGHRVARGQ